MNKILSLLFFFVGLSSIYAQSFEEDKPFIKVNVLVADTNAVYNEMKAVMVAYNDFAGLLGKKTTDQTILDFAASLCANSTVLNTFEINSAQKDISKGKISTSLGKEVNSRSQRVVRAVQELENNLQGSTAIRYHKEGETIIVSSDDSGYNYGSTSSEKEYDGYSMIDIQRWYPYFSVVGKDKDLPTKYIECSIKNNSFRPDASDETLDKMDIKQQNVGYEWLFSENHTSKRISYPIEMSYELYNSHPDLRVSGNGIYDSEGSLKRIILLRRNEPWGVLRIENLEVTDNNGTFSILNGMEGISIQDKIFKALYAYDYNHNKYGIKDNLDPNTRYAIENMVGIQTKEYEIEKMALEYDAARNVKTHAAANNLLSGKALAEFNAIWNKVSKYPPIITAHRDKMRNDKARRWYKQVVSDHQERQYVCYKISRVNDLCFNVEYTERNSTKVILRATVEFYQVALKNTIENISFTRNPQRYKWRIKNVEVIE